MECGWVQEGVALPDMTPGGGTRRAVFDLKANFSDILQWQSLINKDKDASERKALSQ